MYAVFPIFRTFVAYENLDVGLFLSVQCSLWVRLLKYLFLMQEVREEDRKENVCREEKCEELRFQTNFSWFYVN